MKKFARMSLVAAVAVAGLTTANAKPLEEAIKGVDISGSMVYRYDESEIDNAGANDTTDASNIWKIATTIKAPVNDYVTASVRLVSSTGATDTDNGLTGFNTETSAEANPVFNVSNANFTVTTEPVTVIAGKQGLGTPWTVAVDSTGNEQTGTGILALGNAGPVTLAGGYFNQTNLDTLEDGLAGVFSGSEDIITAAVIVPVAGFTFDAWYLDLDDKFDSYTIGAAGSINLDPVKLGLDTRYADLDLDESSNNNKMWKLKLTADMGIFGAKLAYAGTAKEGGLTALDSDSKATYLAWMTTVFNRANADMWHVAFDVDATDTINVAANYATVDYDTNNAAGQQVDNEDEEYYAQVSYKMSSNLSTYVRYGKLTHKVDGEEASERTRGRLNIQYTF